MPLRTALTTSPLLLAMEAPDCGRAADLDDDEVGRAGVQRRE
jgi:hypothetical protein